MSDVTHVIVKLAYPQPRQWMRFDDNYDDEYFGTAKELIMCKDCKYKYTEGENVTANYCLLAHNIAMPDDWHCADAERKEE